MRAEVERDERELLIEAEIAPGRSRVQVNRQRLARTRDLLGALRVTVFAPDDLEMVKGGPATRRRYLDDLLVAHSPKLDVLRTDLDRILKQRNALLKQMAGRHGGGEGALATLEVWDERFATTGSALVAARAALLDQLRPALQVAYASVAGAPAEVGAAYEQSWEGELADALRDAREVDVRRAVTTVGPHRDELALDDRRARRAHTRVAGRAAIGCARDAPRRARGRRAGDRRVSGAAARRRILRAGSDAIRRAPRARAARTGSVDDRGWVARRRASGADRARAPGAAVVSDERHPRTEPRPIGESLDRLSRSLSGMGAQPLVSVFTEWPKVVGDTLAAHCRPLSLDGTKLVIAVDEPAWATQVRYLETELLGRLAEVVEGPPVRSIEVRVNPGETSPKRGSRGGRNQG